MNRDLTVKLPSLARPYGAAQMREGSQEQDSGEGALSMDLDPDLPGRFYVVMRRDAHVLGFVMDLDGVLSRSRPHYMNHALWKIESRGLVI